MTFIISIHPIVPQRHNMACEVCTVGNSLRGVRRVDPQQALPLLVRGELDGGIGHNARHGRAVAAPQRQEALRARAVRDEAHGRTP